MSRNALMRWKVKEYSNDKLMSTAIVTASYLSTEEGVLTFYRTDWDDDSDILGPMEVVVYTTTRGATAEYLGVKNDN